MKHVVNLSGGACSFWAADRVANKYGTADLTLLFADVLIEDPQLYELNEWTAEYFGVPITRVSREMTPWDLFRLEGMKAGAGANGITVQRGFSTTSTGPESLKVATRA